MSEEQNSKHKQSRRKFIKRSAGMIGAMGIGVGLDVHQIDAHDPGARYPWNVDIDPGAAITLFALDGPDGNGLLLNQIIYDQPVREVLRYMSERLDDAVDTEEESDLTRIQFALSLKPRDAGEPGTADRDYIVSYLQDIIVQDLPEDDRSYFELALGEGGNWPGRLSNRLAYLQSVIAMPLQDNEEKRTATTKFKNSNNNGWGRNKHEMNFRNHAGTRTIRRLFTEQKDALTGRYQKSGVDHARKCGLLWCNPKDEYADGRVIRPEITGNGKKCNSQGNACVDSTDETDYCELVDGECNGMSA